MNTIASISTAPGIGGIGIIRMSGENCFDVLEKIFQAKKPQKIEDIKGYSIKYGNIFDDKNNSVDEVLVSYFKAPKSYTTENMCEINTHGGIVVLRKILDLCLKNGAELAEPGEFTKRAFLNGRIDLLQAESVIDIINAKSEKEAKTSINQLEGRLSKKINEIKQKILNVMVNMEVAIDYPEYDVEDATNTQILTMLNEVESDLKTLEKSFDNGKIIKEGIKTAIIGRPNAGKSSLLNAILKEERAIVTDIEGTTRDTIEEFVNVNGIPLNLVDTAGIRDTENEVEKIGVKKSKKIAQDADLVIAIFDSSKELTAEDIDIIDFIKGKKVIIVLNKMDLEAKIDDNNEQLKQVSNNIIKISALNETGIEELYNSISKMFNLNEINIDNEIVITNLRHKNLISKAIDNVKKAKETLENSMPSDIVAINIKEILESLGEITGEEVTDNIINEIFAKFCLGK
ncbi:MAG: tRNA uridine-5-carboxymethylaminomethyl(34) synthesis GTPase MnmE [Clostridia bacterium]|nr:tRNA uridine-5-carboxymethylaminomethyl(34) synthesis GTPase MnmE [Clostridia bacterium]